MSYWVYLEDEKGAVKVPRHSNGGTYAIGGTITAELNITYNYSPHYYEYLNGDEGLRWLDGKTAQETVDALEGAILDLGTVQDKDYWKATKGNAGRALAILLLWAQMNSDAKWRVS
jgi:hypothetical protein